MSRIDLTQRFVGRLIAIAAALLMPFAARAQRADTTQALTAARSSTSYDLAMGFHIGEPASWSITLGIERYRHDGLGNSSFLLIEPGRHADRVSLGDGIKSGDDLATAVAASFRASYLRVRKPNARAGVGSYGGVEGQVLFLGLGARLGVFSSGVRRKPMTMIDFSLGF